MHARWIALALVVGVAAPFAFAHTPAGTPKNYCEDRSEWLVHDYGPVASGVLLYGNEDGNRGGDCNPGFYLHGTPCAGFDDPADPFTFYAGLCDSDLNPPLADWDQHNEFAFGGAWLLVRSGEGLPSADPTVGAGTLYCFGAEGHHADYPTVAVEDLVLGGARLTVASDTVDTTGMGDGCGDFESDESATGYGSVTVTFPAGFDGAYYVYVEGTLGHVCTDGACESATRTTGLAPTLGSGGTMEFDGSGGQPRVSAAPGWSCQGPVQVGDGWEIACFPIGPLAGSAVNRVVCTSPYAVAGGTPVSSGTAQVTASCSGGYTTGCSTAWVVVGACMAPPPALLVDSFPLRCRAQVLGSTIGGTLFASCGNLA